MSICIEVFLEYHLYLHRRYFLLYTFILVVLNLQWSFINFLSFKVFHLYPFKHHWKIWNRNSCSFFATFALLNTLCYYKFNYWKLWRLGSFQSCETFTSLVGAKKSGLCFRILSSLFVWKAVVNYFYTLYNQSLRTSTKFIHKKFLLREFGARLCHAIHAMMRVAMGVTNVGMKEVRSNYQVIIDTSKELRKVKTTKPKITRDITIRWFVLIGKTQFEMAIIWTAAQIPCTSLSTRRPRDSKMSWVAVKKIS